jgi:hypothetical protein
MNTRLPGQTDHSSRRSASLGQQPENWDQSSQLRGFPLGGLRASDAERDAALAELGAHFQAGRLTAEELDERTSRILAARTGDELEVELRDLPNLAAPVDARPQYRQPRPPRIASYLAPRLVMAVVILAVIASVLTLGAGHHGVHTWNYSAVPVVLILLIGRHLARHR